MFNFDLASTWRKQSNSSRKYVSGKLTDFSLFLLLVRNSLNCSNRKRISELLLMPTDRPRIEISRRLSMCIRWHSHSTSAHVLSDAGDFQNVSESCPIFFDKSCLNHTSANFSTIRFTMSALWERWHLLGLCLIYYWVNLDWNSSCCSWRSLTPTHQNLSVVIFRWTWATRCHLTIPFSCERHASGMGPVEIQ